MHNQVPSDPVPPPPAYSPPPGSPPPHPPPFSGAPPAYPPPGWQPPPQEPTNGFAIASLVLGLLGLCAPAGIVFGIMALKQLKRSPQRGRGIAIAGIALSSSTVLVAAAFVVVGIFSAAPRGEKTGQIATYRLEAGQCIRSLRDSPELSSVPVVDCAQPHEAEVYHVFMFPAGPYPGENTVDEIAGQQCRTALQPYLTAENPDLPFSYLYPQKDSWERADRGVTCIVVHRTGTVTGSIVD